MACLQSMNVVSNEMANARRKECTPEISTPLTLQYSDHTLPNLCIESVIERV